MRRRNRKDQEEEGEDDGPKKVRVTGGMLRFR